jgi:guanylate kinase
VLSGPSGVGKSSVVAEVVRLNPAIWLSVSVTTRSPRAGEQDGVDYHFVDEPEFRRMVDAGELLEYDDHFNAWYGTPRQPVEDRLAAGVPVLLEIDVNGARQVRAARPDSLLVFLAPPSWEELARRLSRRGTEEAAQVRRRLDRARMELAAEDEFDTSLVNADVREAAERLLALVTLP